MNEVSHHIVRVVTEYNKLRGTKVGWGIFTIILEFKSMQCWSTCIPISCLAAYRTVPLDIPPYHLCSLIYSIIYFVFCCVIYHKNCLVASGNTIQQTSFRYCFSVNCVSTLNSSKLAHCSYVRCISCSNNRLACYLFSSYRLLTVLMRDQVRFCFFSSMMFQNVCIW